MNMQNPNIIFILADDLGYGDVACYNPESKVPTPNLDKLASQGLRFTDAHAPATICSPSRYSVLTGRMAFRTGVNGVFTGAGSPNMIESSRLTVPQLLREKGYTTACFGKWHVGLTFMDKDGNTICENGLEAAKRVDFSRPIIDAPIHRGFDHFFGTACCCGTDHLYCYIDGDLVPVPPTGMLDKDPLPDHVYSTDNRDGLVAPDFDIEEVDQVLLKKSQAFIRDHVKNTPDKPFFLYHPTNAVHLP
jgi:arylsulfatase A